MSDDSFQAQAVGDLQRRVAKLESEASMYLRTISDLLESMRHMNLRLRSVERAIPHSDPARKQRSGRPAGAPQFRRKL